MAELQFPDIVGQYQQGLTFGRKVRAEDQARQNKSRLAELAAQAYGANPEDQRGFVQQAIGVDPEAGFALGGQLQKQGDQQTQELVRAARFLKAAPVEQKQAAWSQVRGSLAQRFPQMQLPEVYDASVDQTVNALDSAYGGGGANLGDRFRNVGGNLIDLAGDPTKPIFSAPEGPRYFQTDQGLVAVGPEGAREVTLGGVQPPAMVQESGGRPVTISPDLDPATRAAIAANPDAFAALPDESTVQVPGVVPGRRLLPATSAADAERLRLAQDAGRRAEDASRRASEAAARSERGNAPAGFRFKADGTLEPIPGGPKPAGATATEGERKAATLLQRLRGSQAQMQAAIDENPSAASPSVGARIARGLPLVGEIAENVANSPERQRVEAAQLDILDAALTLGTGAAYTREQLEGYRRAFFPQIGDSQPTIRDKAARLQNVISAAELAAGRAGPQVPGGGAPREITSQAEYDALPSGAVYLEDGQQYRKP